MHQNTLGLFGRYIRDINPSNLAVHGKNYIAHYSNTLRQNITNNWTPTAAGVEITYSCRRRCRDCYIPDDTKKNNEMIDENLFRRIVRECRKNSVNFIGIIGGEPISELTLPLIIPVLKDNPYTSFFICSNGDHIADNGLDGLGDVNNLAYSISVDGFEKSHNKIRGKGSFQNVVRSFEKLRDSRKLYGASVTIRKDTFEELTSPEFLEFLSDQGAKFVHFMKLKTSDEHNLTTDEFEEAKSLIRSFSTDYPTFVVFGGPGSVGTSPEFEYREIFFEPNGNVRVTKQDVTENIGNILDEDLENLIRRFDGPL